MDKSLISIIVPVYNTLPYLEKCVNSLLVQTHSNLEIILVDDGSTDGSSQLCDDLAAKDERIKVFHKQNGGVSSARNAGLAKATGNYIGFVDSDDWVEPDMYAILLELIQKNNAQIAGCNFNYIQNNIYVADIKTINKTSVFTLQQTVKNDMAHRGIYLWNKLFDKEILHGLQFDESITFGEDMLFCFNAILKADKIVYSDLKKYIYNRNVASATLKSFNIKKLTFFKAIATIMDYSEKIKDRQLYKMILRAKIYHIVGFLRQAATAGYADKNKDFDELLANLRANIFDYLFSKYKLTNKLFGVILALFGYKFTAKIYRMYTRIFS
jgi:glycosyltransferase involved in cell wall biosynthesis